MNTADINIYKYAAQNGLRFSTTKGTLTVEDLYHLNDEDLNAAYKALAAEKSKTTDSLIEAATAENTELEVKIQLIRDVFETKKAAKKAKEEAESARAQKQRIAAIIASKEDAALESKSIEELKAMLND